MEKPKKILIVDDEPDILEFLSYNFRRRGYTVVTANDGTEGLKKVYSQHPQVVISDILMPGMDGIELCREVRKDLLLRSIPFIFLTAVSDDYKILYAMTSGADQFVSKPIKFEYLLQIVGQTIEEKALQA